MNAPTILPGVMLWLAVGAGTHTIPPSPYIDVGACPFECCVYRDWRAERETQLFDRPNGNKLAKLDKGEWVKALGGETHSIPLRVVASRKIDEAGIRPGEVFYVLHYEGESYWKIWYRGKTFDAEANDSRTPKTTWWARVQRRNGSIGWVIAGGERLVIRMSVDSTAHCNFAGPIIVMQAACLTTED